MKKNVFWRFLIIGATVIVAIVFFLPNTPLFEYMPHWWQKNMPHKGIVMGLDLQGGLHLVYEVEGDKAVETSLKRFGDLIENYIKSNKMNSTIQMKGLTMEITPSSPALESMIRANYPVLSEVSTGQKLVLKMSDKQAAKIRDDAADQAIETIRNRIDQLGVTEPSIQRQGESEVVVELPGVKDPGRAIDIIGKTAQLEFKLVDDEAHVAAQLPSAVQPGNEKAVLKEYADKIPAGDQILFERKLNAETGIVSEIPILLKKDAVLTGDALSNAKVSLNSQFGQPYVSISFNSAGAKRFEEITAANVKKRLAIILDNNVYSAPVIQERISGGNAQITGNFSMAEAKDLAIVLRAGALPAPLKMLQNVTVGPTLGSDSVRAGKIAGIIGTLLVIVFMFIYYRGSGLIADFALVLNLILLFGAMAFLNATLTLPGIAGIILAVGMAVDSNVLMFERIREEIRAGKPARSAIDSGYDKAWWTIFDSHVTTLITAAVLFQFGTGPIKGFAVTLSLGVAINLFTALVGTKSIFDLITSRYNIKKVSI